MRKKIVGFLQYAIFIIGGILLVWWQLHSMTDEQEATFRQSLAQANYILIIPVIIMNMLSHLSRSMRWKILMRSLNYNPKLKNVFAVTMVGYLANSFVPRIGEIVKCTLLAKYENLKTDKLIGTIIIERTFDLICYAVFLLITVLIQINVIGNYVSEKFTDLSKKNNAALWIKIALIFVFVIAIVFVFKKLAGLYPQNKILIKIKEFAKGVMFGFTSIKNLKDRKGFLLHTFFIWAMYLLQIYIGFKAMEATAGLNLKAACAVLSLSTLAMIVTPGGLGSFPLFIMETLLMYGVAKTQGFAFGWLIWGVSTALIIVVGITALIVLLSSKIKINENPTSHTQ